MKGYISIEELSEVIEFVAGQGDAASQNSGLKKQFEAVMYGGWCCALDTIIFALALPVDTDTDPGDSAYLQEVIARFAKLREKVNA